MSNIAAAPCEEYMRRLLSAVPRGYQAQQVADPPPQRLHNARSTPDQAR